MEKTAISNLDPHLPNGYTTVGTRMDVKHVKASPVGANVQCHSELTAIEGRRLVFHIDAFDEKGRIGEAVHERFVVNKEHFMNKLQ
ncbi:MAG: hypothetical protein SPJ13_04115 [Bacteroidales bacterium]|nr:hypothetical protein [Bacteroidales bacterium]